MRATEVSPVTEFLITAHDGCTVEGSMLASSNPATYVGLPTTAPSTSQCRLVGTTPAGQSSSVPSPMVTLSGGTTPTAAMSAGSTQHYQLSSPGLQTFTDIDSTNLVLSTTTAAAAQTAVVTGNLGLFITSIGPQPGRRASS